MRAVFGADLPEGLLDDAFLQWKFFAPHPGWDGARSYVVRDAGSIAGQSISGESIAAHACVWPTGFETPAGTVSSSHLIDWFAKPSVPGAGIALYRDLMRRTDTVVAIGGSSQARKLLPKIGFRPYATFCTYACVVRPWKQFRTRPHGPAWREFARLGRNTSWSLHKVPSPPSGWSAEPAARVEDPLPVARASTFSPGHRSAPLLNYLLACPAAACRYFRVFRDAALCGYFLLNQVAGQCRIIDLRVESDHPGDWRSAYRLAVRTASALEETCEVIVVSALPWLNEMLQQDGLRLRDERPVVLHDPHGRLAGAPPLHLQMVDSDAFFLYSRSYPFVT